MKIDRKELKRPDAYVVKGRVALEFLAKQRTRFFPILILFIVIVGAVYGYEIWSEKKLTRQWLAYSEILKISGDEKWSKLEKFYNNERFSRAAYLAAVTLGDHFFDQNRELVEAVDPKRSNQSAADWYSRALEFKDLLPKEKQLILMNRGKSLELDKKLDEAANDFKQAADLGGDLKALALLNLGRIYELKNELAQALETYDKITIDFLNSRYARLAKLQIHRLKSPLLKNKKL